MAVEYLQTVSVPVTSQDQAKEFYVNGLGWDLLSDEEYGLADGQHLRWLEVRPPRQISAFRPAHPIHWAAIRGSCLVSARPNDQRSPRCAAHRAPARVAPTTSRLVPRPDPG